MGKKDVARLPPVELYRQRIGKEQFKREKRALNETKTRADVKKGGDTTSRGAAYSFVVLLGLVALLVGVYLGGYHYLGGETERVLDTIGCGVDMLEYIGLYTLLYLLFTLCVIVPPTEFISAGLTIEYMCKGLLGSEQQSFVKYHLRRVSLNLLAHSLLPLFYFLTLQLVDESTWVHFVGNFEQLSIVWKAAVSVSIALPTCVVGVVLYWYMHDWRCHPLVRLLRLYDEDWHRVAAVIDREYVHFDKFTATLGGIRRVVVTDSWLIVISSYSVRLSQQADVRLTVIQTDEHVLSHLYDSDQQQTGVQFLSVLVENVSKPVRPFTLRLAGRDYQGMRMKISAPIQAARDIIIQQSINERFVAAFEQEVRQNPLYPLSDEARLAIEPCIGCLQTDANVKLQKRCVDGVAELDAHGNRVTPCRPCFCRPNFCLPCMGRWFASRQDQKRPDTWLSSKCPCPTCRATFCIFDVCVVQTQRPAT